MRIEDKYKQIIKTEYTGRVSFRILAEGGQNKV